MNEPEPSVDAAIRDFVAGVLLFGVGVASDGSALARSLRTETWPSIELDLAFDVVAVILVSIGVFGIARWVTRRNASRLAE